MTYKINRVLTKICATEKDFENKNASLFCTFARKILGENFARLASSRGLVRPAQSLNKTLKTGRQNIVYSESVHSALRRQGLSHENAVEEINELKYPDVYTCDVGKLFEEIWQTLEEGSDYDEAEMETIVDTHLKERYEQDCNKLEPHSPGPLDETASDCDEIIQTMKKWKWPNL